MTENNAGTEPDATPTVSQAVSLPEQQPVTPAPVVVADRKSHTRTILEVVGGVVAVGLIFVSGAAGFVLGHVTAQHDGRGDGSRMMLSIDRDDARGPGVERGQGMPDGPRLQSRPDMQGRPDMEGGPGLQGMPDSAPDLPQQGTAPSVPQG